MEKTITMSIQFQDQKHQLEEAHMLQITAATTKLQASLTKNYCLERFLSRKTEENKAMKQEFEAEVLQLHNDSKQLKSMIEQLQSELKTSNEDKDTLRQAQSIQTQELRQEFETVQNLFGDEIRKLKSEANEHQNAVITLEEKLETIQQKNNCSMDQISKLTEELKAERQQLEPFLAQERINQQTIEDEMSLVSAVEERNLEKVCSILKNTEMDINSTIRFEAKKIEGPILTLAIQNGDIKMIKLLVQDFGTNVNQTITWNQNRSNFLILAMATCFERYI